VKFISQCKHTHKTRPQGKYRDSQSNSKEVFSTHFFTPLCKHCAFTGLVFIEFVGLQLLVEHFPILGSSFFTATACLYAIQCVQTASGDIYHVEAQNSLWQADVAVCVIHKYPKSLTTTNICIHIAIKNMKEVLSFNHPYKFFTEESILIYESDASY
jgi:hypothetical protein